MPRPSAPPPAAAPAPATATPAAQPLQGRPAVIRLQTALNRLGFDVGQPDGARGDKTRRAIIDYQRTIGVPADGVLTQR